MRILIACDKFKGSLSAKEVAFAIEKGLGKGFQIQRCPIADGGEGFVDSMIEALGGEKVNCEVVDAMNRPVRASYGKCGTTAIIEMAEASGLWRIEEDVRDILQANTKGTGQLIAHAIRGGSKKLLMGLGGSATNDGGAGMAAHLGWKFSTRNKTLLANPTPSELLDLETVDGTESINFPEIEVACDVENPLLGERGATAIFSPQKGASLEQQKQLEAMLAHLAKTAQGDDIAEMPGAGAAGGMGWGLMKFTGATLRSGFDIVADAVGLQEKIMQADVVITGEGSLDSQSLEGKGPIGVARLAKAQGKRVVAIAGHISDSVKRSGLIDDSCSLADTGLPLEELIAHAAELVESEARKVSGLLIG